MHRTQLSLAALALFVATTALAQDRDTKVRNDLLTFKESEDWVYNDLERGIRAAEAQKKPLLVIFRCIPCEACQEFDDSVAHRDPIVRDLMDQFICVRIVQANAMDLAQFQFDFDQSFAVFMMHPDRTLLSRFGTRSNRDDETKDISLAGLRKALDGALAMHRNYERVKPLLAGKQVSSPRFKRPEEYPTLAGRYQPKLDYEGAVAKSCMHCHQIGEAERLVYRNAGQAVPDNVLFPYPNPRVLGMNMDPKEMATIQNVAAGSSAEHDGFRAGDQIVSLAGQPLLSTADIQWVLHHAPANGELPAEVNRGGQKLSMPLTLKPGWRKEDISWRATTWDLRRMGLGGMQLEDLRDAERTGDLAGSGMALRLKHVGQYGDHAVAKNAGFQKDDIIVAFDGQTGRTTEADLLAHTLQKKRAGDEVTATVLRSGQRKELSYRLQ